jgi:hypothetical protein
MFGRAVRDWTVFHVKVRGSGVRHWSVVQVNCLWEGRPGFNVCQCDCQWTVFQVNICGREREGRPQLDCLSSSCKGACLFFRVRGLRLFRCISVGKCECHPEYLLFCTCHEMGSLDLPLWERCVPWIRNLTEFLFQMRG